MAGIFIDSDAAKASAGVVNLQSAAARPNIVQFQMAAAQEFIVNQIWDGLEAYLSEFLTEVQGDKFYPHPGLFCSLYQAQISYLIGKKQFEEAETVFDNKVGPLERDRDGMYAPVNLEYRVDILKDCVYHCLPLPTNEVEDIDVVLSDYMMLYFPTSLQGKANRTYSISDFIVTFDDEKGKRHRRCLACQEIISASGMTSSIVSHIKQEEEEVGEEDNSCPRATVWMLKYLAYIQGGEEEFAIQDPTAASAGAQSRKRMAPPPTVPDLYQHSVVLPVQPALRIFRDLSWTNLEAIGALGNDNSQSVTRSKAEVIVFRQEELITELKTLLLNSMIQRLSMGSPLAFLKIKALLSLSDDLLPLLKSLPDDVSKLLLEQDEKVTELRRFFMVAAAKRLPPTASADVNSSVGSSKSNTSRIQETGPL